MRVGLLLLALLGQFAPRANYAPPEPAQAASQPAASCCCCSAGTVCTCGCDDSGPGASGAGQRAGRSVCACAGRGTGVLEARTVARWARASSAGVLLGLTAVHSTLGRLRGSLARALQLREHDPPDEPGRLPTYQLLI